MSVGNRSRVLLKLVAMIVICLIAQQSSTQQLVFVSSADAGGLGPILNYIHGAWDTLSRSMSDCGTVVDPKLAEDSVLYLPAGIAKPDSIRDLQQRCRVQVRELSVAITGPGQVSTTITPAGLLYLPNRYVVPGGRFNEMYGWDSNFIVRGLIEKSGALLIV